MVIGEKMNPMKKRSFVFILLLSIFLFLSSEPESIGSDKFSFAEINWTDNNTQAAEKIKNSGFSISLRTIPKKTNSIAGERGIPLSTIKDDNKIYNFIESKIEQKTEFINYYLIDANLLERIEKSKDGNVDFPISDGYVAYSSITNKLLLYCLHIGFSSTEIITKSLLDKYGEPKKITRNDSKYHTLYSFLWSNGNEKLYFNNNDSDYHDLVYMNITSLYEHIDKVHDSVKLQDKINNNQLRGKF